MIELPKPEEQDNPAYEMIYNYLAGYLKGAPKGEEKSVLTGAMADIYAALYFVQNVTHV